MLKSSLLYLYFYVWKWDDRKTWKVQHARAPVKRNVLYLFEDFQHAIFFAINLFNSALFAGLVTELTVRGQSSITFDPNLTITSWILQLTGIVLWENLVEYYWHRAMHLPTIYRFLHKYHHRFKAPEPFCDMFIHPLEAFGYYCILYSPAILFRIDYYTLIAYMIIMGVCGVLDHSGIKLRIPFVYDTRDHDLHHALFDVNYGFPVPWLDILHGTYVAPQSD